MLRAPATQAKPKKAKSIGTEPQGNERTKKKRPSTQKDRDTSKKSHKKSKAIHSDTVLNNAIQPDTTTATTTTEHEPHPDTTTTMTTKTTFTVTPVGNKPDENMVWRASSKRKDIITGPYSKAEKESMKNAVEQYATSKGLSTTDFSWLIAPGRGKKPKEIVGLWKEVAAALPNRTIKSVAAAGLRMFHPLAQKGKWSPEEDAQLAALVVEKGRKWTEIGLVVSRTGDACRDRYREVELSEKKRNRRWLADEEHRLVDAVREYQRTLGRLDYVAMIDRAGDVATAMDGHGSGGTNLNSCVENYMNKSTPKADAEQEHNTGSRKQEDRFQRRKVLDDINWEVISKKVETRTPKQCMEKWYDQMRPSMIESGEWGAGDDRRMLRALWSLQADFEYEVPWDQLVKGREEAAIRRRWRLMAKTVPDSKEKGFKEIVEYLVDTHIPHLKTSQA